MNELPHLPNEEVVRNNLKQDRVNWMTYKAKSERAEGLDANLNSIRQEYMDRIDRSLDKLGILIALQSVEVVEVDE